MNSVSIVASGGHLTADTAAFGCAGDHLATELAVHLAEDLCGAGYTYRLLFEAADGFRCMTERLVPSTDHVLTFALPSSLTVEGALHLQLLVYAGDDVVAHTPLCEPTPQIAPSITPDSPVPAEYDGLVVPGVGIVDATVTDRHLFITYQDHTVQDAGEVAPDFSSIILSVTAAGDAATSAAADARRAAQSADSAALAATAAAAAVPARVASLDDLQANRIAFDPTGGETGAANVQAALEAIEARINGSVIHTPTSWADVRQMVRGGVAHQAFRIGDELLAEHAVFGVQAWRIIGFDCEQSDAASTPFVHSLTLQLCSCLPTPQAFSTANSNNWKNSTARAWLNSTFLEGMDPAMRAVLGAVKKQTTVRVGETSFDLEKTVDTVFLPSRIEVYAGTEQLSEGMPYEYYTQTLPASEGGSNMVRVRYATNGGSTSAVGWWLRSPDAYSGYAVRRVGPNGQVDARSACNTDNYLLPVCVVV